MDLTGPQLPAVLWAFGRLAVPVPAALEWRAVAPEVLAALDDQGLAMVVVGLAKVCSRGRNDNMVMCDTACQRESAWTLLSTSGCGTANLQRPKKGRSPLK